MTREEEWRREWEGLRAERDLARRRWCEASAGLSAWTRDPLGLGGILKGHPVAAAGIGAALAALLVKFLGRRPALGTGEEAAAPPAAWTAVLRDAAVGVAVPWLVRFVAGRFGGDPATGEGKEGTP